MLDRRPLLAGVLFGLLAYKPQFGLMIPLVLVASGRWRTLCRRRGDRRAAGARGTLAFGPRGVARVPRTRRASPASSCSNRATPAGTRSRACSPGCGCGARRSRSPTLCKAHVTLALAAALVWLWRSAAPFALKAAALCIAAILATPYSLDYDLMVLAPAIAFLAADGLRARLRALRKNRAGRALAGAADRAQCRAGDADSARRVPAMLRDVCSDCCGARTMPHCSPRAAMRAFLPFAPVKFYATRSCAPALCGHRHRRDSSRRAHARPMPCMRRGLRRRAMYTLYSMQRSGNSYKVRLALGAARHSLPADRDRHPQGREPHARNSWR